MEEIWNMKKYSILLAVVLCISVFFGGCGNKSQQAGTEKPRTASMPEQAQNNPSGSSQGDVKKEETGYPLTVKDAKNVEVTLEKKPEAIVSLTLGTDEMLLELVDKARIKALSALSADPGLSNILDAARDFPEKVNNNEIEKIVSLQPDLVFMADWVDEKAIKQLRDSKVNVYVCKTPNNVDEVKKAIAEIAHLLGEDKRGEELTGRMDEKLKDVDEKVKRLKEDQKLTAVSLDSFFYTYGKGTTFDDITARAGVINLASKAGITMWQEITKEKIVEMNPDVIFLPSWSYKGFDAGKFAEDFKKDKSLAGVKAVKNNRVFMLREAHMTSVSQNIVLGVEDVMKTVYPELFK